MIVPFPIAFFIATLATDPVYAGTGDVAWARGSMWLLGAGIAMALLAAVLGFTDFMGERRIRRLRHAWFHMVGNLVAVVLAVINFGVRAQEGPEAAASAAGLGLSIVVAALLLFNGWMGWELVYHHHVGVSDETPPEPEGAVRARSR
jgi:uncharacterized membrane protein